MKDNPLFSIIIPVYNVAPYLRECLDSVLSQTFTDWEAICVDDGSIDASGVILDKYAKQDARFRVIHQPNSGVSHARNIAIDSAKGEWIWFVDADDAIHPEALKHVASVCKHHSDIDGYAFRRFIKSNDIVSWPALEPNMPYVSCRRGFEEFLSFRRSIWVCIFKNKYVANLHFQPYVMGEDLLYSSTLFWSLKKFAIDDVPLYFYRTRQGGATKGEVYARLVRDDFETNRLILECASKHKNYWDEDVVSCLVNMMPRYFTFAYEENLLKLHGMEIRGVIKSWCDMQMFLASHGLAMRYAALIANILRVLPFSLLAYILLHILSRLNNRSFAEAFLDKVRHLLMQPQVQ